MATYDIDKFTFGGNTYNLMGGITNAYSRTGTTPLSAAWLSETSGGSALTPKLNQVYILMANSGDYTANSMFRWNGTAYEPLTGKEVHVELTQAEYDVLTPAQKNNGIVYFITDAEAYGYNAEDISATDKDGHESTVQDELDGLNEKNSFLVGHNVTSDTNAIITTSYSRDEYSCIEATTGGAICIPFVSTYADGGKICCKLTNLELSPVPNTTVQLTLRLIKK